MHEIELKFQIPESRFTHLRQRFLQGRTEAVRMQAHYFDTADGLLAGHEIALRLRLEGSQWVQTLKASGAHGVSRLEHNAALPADAARDGSPTLDIDRHRGSPAHQRLVDVLGDTVLHEVFRTEVDRIVRVFTLPGGAEIEAALDTGQVVAGAATHPLREIEFEWKAGPLHSLFALASDWVAEHGLWLDIVSKAERGTLLSRGQSHPVAARAKPPQLAADADGPVLARAAIGSCLAQVLRNASAVASGSRQPEHVHQLRIGLRRLRVVLREMAPLDCGLDPGWEAPIAELFRLLGTDRDQQILEDETADALAAAGAPPLTRPRLPAGAEPLDARVQHAEVQQVLLAVQAYAMEASAVSGGAHEGPAVATLGDRLDALLHRLIDHSRGFVDASVDDQHAVRKELKRLRYLAEFIAPLYRDKPVARFFDALAPAQDALGKHNDLAVALAAYRERAVAEPEAWFAVGWLAAQQARSARAARKALKRAGQAEPFWHGKPRG
ncbi:CYTH and CHAD domain-containing protein [Rhizobacter sp. P5_C2]